MVVLCCVVLCCVVLRCVVALCYVALCCVVLRVAVHACCGVGAASHVLKRQIFTPTFFILDT